MSALGSLLSSRTLDNISYYLSSNFCLHHVKSLFFQELPSSSSSESAASSNGVNGEQQQQQSDPSNGDAAASASSPSKPDLLGDLVPNSDRRVQEENERNLEASEKGAVDSEIKENNRYTRTTLSICKPMKLFTLRGYPIFLLEFPTPASLLYPPLISCQPVEH